MWTEDKILRETTKLGFKPRQTKSELKHLHKVLHEDEPLYAIMEGELKKIHNKSQVGRGVVLLTDRRVIFFRKSIIGTITNEETPIQQISSTSYRKGLLLSSIHVYTANNESEVLGAHNDCQMFQSIMQQKIHSKLNPLPPAKEVDSIDKLEKLFSLKNSGAITEDEYQQQKNLLLK